MLIIILNIITVIYMVRRGREELKKADRHGKQRRVKDQERRRLERE